MQNDVQFYLIDYANEFDKGQLMDLFEVLEKLDICQNNPIFKVVRNSLQTPRK